MYVLLVQVVSLTLVSNITHGKLLSHIKKGSCI